MLAGNRSRKVFDCFPFWKELGVLEIRLNELFDVVDKFIIVESSYTHSGLKKQLYLKNNIEMFSKFKDKILLISDESFNEKHTPTERAIAQRKKIDEGLRLCNAKPEDLVIVSDCDEIPRANVIVSLTKNPVNSILELDGYISFYNLFLQKWRRGRVLLYRDFKGAQYVHRDQFVQIAYKMKRFKYWPFLRVNPFFAVGKVDKIFGMWVGFKILKQIPIIPNAGWHFTKMFSDDLKLDSIRASSHVEFNSPSIDIEFIKKRRQNHQVFYGNLLEGKEVKLDNTFPHYLLLNKDKFKEFIL
jgi:beta-1,4-mannosyl-glycoprotein beta-1,4-N-acetylglucosaminyltransferase